MIPKVQFVYSDIYDNHFRSSSDIKHFLNQKGWNYPSEEKMRAYPARVSKLWAKQGEAILKAIQKFSGLRWTKKEIKCYLVGWCSPISEPLTIGRYEDDQKILNTLVHELIHQIQSQAIEASAKNVKRWEKWAKWLYKKYSRDSITTRSHVFLLSVHQLVLLNLFGSKVIAEEISFNKKFKDYRRAWEIVEKKGAEEIIARFKEIFLKKK